MGWKDRCWPGAVRDSAMKLPGDLSTSEISLDGGSVVVWAVFPSTYFPSHNGQIRNSAPP